MGTTVFGELLLEKLKASKNEELNELAANAAVSGGAREKIRNYNTKSEEEYKLTVEEKNTRRKDDDKDEKRFNQQFMVPVFYPALIKMGLAECIEDVKDKNDQCAGHDAHYYKNGKIINVDNKNRTSVVNKTNHRIPVEIFTDNKQGVRIDGWFTDEEKNTDYICSTHCFSKNRDEKIFKYIDIQDINYVDAYMFKVNDLKSFLAANKISMEDLKDIAREFENKFIEKYKNNKWNISPDDRCVSLLPGVDLYTSYFKPDVKENPTVILVDENIIKKLRNTRHFNWDDVNGLYEIPDKSLRPPLSPSEENIKRRSTDIER